MPSRVLVARIEALETRLLPCTLSWGYTDDELDACAFEFEAAAKENRRMRKRGLNPAALSEFRRVQTCIAASRRTQAEYETAPVADKIACMRREIAELEKELARPVPAALKAQGLGQPVFLPILTRLLEVELMVLEGASEDDIAIARFIAWQETRTGRSVDRPATVDELPYAYWPESRRKAHEDAAATRVWEEQHQQDWQRERGEAEEGEIMPKAALPAPQPRRLPPPSVPREVDPLTAYRGSPDLAKQAQEMVYFQPGAE